jgi:hypothetical protein
MSAKRLRIYAIHQDEEVFELWQGQSNKVGLAP